jgi:hypothetical protein
MDDPQETRRHTAEIQGEITLIFRAWNYAVKSHATAPLSQATTRLL